MFFSVVVPTHNRPQQLKRLLDSLIKQSLSSSVFEVIVVPSPNDSGLTLLKETAENLKITLRVLELPNDPYKGRSASHKRNEGARVAKGQWLAFIDDDCTADPNWLSAATALTRDSEIFGIEGLTQIPKPEKETYTYKGLKRLSNAGGYQTCNMFYKRKDFLDIGGFDLNFPFYLEDTDLAWSFLDRGKKIVFAPQCVVSHPVPAPEVKRLIDGAVRARKIPYLYKKHPDLFKKSHIQPLSRSQMGYLGLYAMLVPLLVLLPASAPYALGVFFALHLLYCVKLLRGCSFTLKEFLGMFFYLLLTPPIAFFQLLRGNLENKTFLIFNNLRTS